MSVGDLYPLAQGGTAVGTGLNSKPKFAHLFAKHVAKITKLPFTSAANKFEALAPTTPTCSCTARINSVATGLFKIANDIRLLGSGRARARRTDPARERAGSSIMPGKVNPTQCEAMTMVCCRCSATNRHHGRRQPGPFRAERLQAGAGILYDAFHPMLSDVARSFTEHCVEGIRADEKRIRI
jgi:fumarate hydratase class II